jgi:hypothetical protein
MEQTGVGIKNGQRAVFPAELLLTGPYFPTGGNTLNAGIGRTVKDKVSGIFFNFNREK